LLYKQFSKKVTADESTPLLDGEAKYVDSENGDKIPILSLEADEPPRCSVFKAYTDLLERHPLAVKSITAFFILGGGDLCGQGIEHMRGMSDYTGVDWPRVARFGAFGLFGAPWSHFYFHYLDMCLPPTPKPFTWTTLFKVLIDQFIQAPLLLAIMIIALAIMKGEGLAGAKHSMMVSYWVTLIANCKLKASVVELFTNSI
jgi:peroxisomal membrane protein 2